MTDTTIYHNPAYGTSRNTLALIRNSGIEPEVIDDPAFSWDVDHPDDLTDSMRRKANI